MDGEKKGEDLPHRDAKDIEEKASESRERLDEVPEHGADPLSEGP